MFTQMPQMTTTRMSVANTNQLQVDCEFQNREVPEKQRTFLEKFGWVNAGNHPDTQEELFRKPCPTDASDAVRKSWDWELGSGYWHWYEAVAYEFTKFIGIDDDSGKSNPNMGSASSAAPQSPDGRFGR